MPALGDEFRSAREARGLSLSDVAEQIHIRSVYLSAIEDEDWPAIGAPVYVRGFIRTYARFLGLDGERAVQMFNETAPAEKAAPAAAAPTVAAYESRERSGPSLWAILGTLVAVALVAFVGYQWWLYSEGGKTAVAARATPGPPAASPLPAPAGAQPSEAPGGSPSGAPSGAPSPSPSPSPSPTHPPHALAVRLTQTSWLRVVVDGKNVAEGLFPAGTSRTFTGSVVDLRVGNAGGVLVSVDGSTPKTLGGNGDVVEERYTL